LTTTVNIKICRESQSATSQTGGEDLDLRRAGNKKECCDVNQSLERAVDRREKSRMWEKRMQQLQVELANKKLQIEEREDGVNLQPGRRRAVNKSRGRNGDEGLHTWAAGSGARACTHAALRAPDHGGERLHGQGADSQ